MLVHLSLRSATTDLFLEGFDLLFEVLVDLALDLDVPVLFKYDKTRKEHEKGKALAKGLAKKRSRTLELRNALHAGAGSGGGISEEVHGRKRIGKSRVSCTETIGWSVVDFLSWSGGRA